MNKFLDYFGQILIKNVRDKTICEFNMIIDGKMKDKESVMLYRNFKCMDKETKQIIKSIIPRIVDLGLHNFLWMFEEDENIQILVQGKNINDISDGLAGELYAEDGWICKFSKK